jgi:hypothetical protein
VRVWTILPGEFARAYAWRLRVDNVLSGSDELAAELWAVEGSGRTRSYSPDRTIALLRRLEMSGNELVCRHSLVPISKCVATFDLKSPTRPDFGDRWYLGFALWSSAPARLCRACVGEDLSFLGIAYWRRSHQLPGITWCTKHQRPLSESRRQNAFAQSPRAALEKAIDLPSRDVEAAIKSPVVQRYVSILEGLLENAKGPVHSACAAHVIRTQATAEGFKVIPWRQAHYLSDAATQQTPKRWLRDTFPASQSKRPREFAPWIDQAGHARTNPVGATTFALALAILWTDPDDALATFLGANVHAQTNVRRRQKGLELNEQAMRDIWLRNRGRYFRIAQETGWCHKTVRSKFTEAGLVSLGGSGFSQIEAAMARFFRGEGIVAASHAEGVDVGMVEALIRASGRETDRAGVGCRRGAALVGHAQSQAIPVALTRGSHGQVEGRLETGC